MARLVTSACTTRASTSEASDADAGDGDGGERRDDEDAGGGQREAIEGPGRALRRCPGGWRAGRSGSLPARDG